MKILNKFIVKLAFICLSLSGAGAMEDHDCAQCRGAIGTSIHGSTGKWLNQDVPHRDWTCEEVEDLGSASQTCQMCERETIRYVHRMRHDDHESLDVGCVCAGHMEGDLEAARARDSEMNSRKGRRENWLNLGWKTSNKGNPYLKTRKNKADNNQHLVTITKGKNEQFSARVDNAYINTWYNSMEEAKLAAFDHIWPGKVTR